MSWDGIRGTLHWLLLLLLVGVIAACGAALHWWTAKDALLVEAVQSRLDELLPDCRIEFESVRLSGSSRLELVHLSLRARETDVLLARVPRVVAELEPDLLREHRRVVITDVSIQSPEVRAIRGHDGRWSWEGISPPVPSAAASPAWTVTDGTVRVGFESVPGGPIQTIACRGIQLELNPRAHRRYEISGGGIADAVGPLSLEGFIDGNSGAWHLSGTAGEVRLGDPLLDLAGRFVPQVQRQLAELRFMNQGFRTLAGPERLRVASLANAPPPLSTEPSPERTDGGDAGSLMRADLSLSFSLGRMPHQPEIDYHLRGEIQHGQVSELLLPIPLYDLEGIFEITPRKVRIDALKAGNGGSTLFVNGAAHRVGEHWKKDFLIQATRLQLDERVRAFLSGPLLESYDMVRPSGTFDLDLGFSHEPGSSPEIKLKKFTAIDFRALCEFFQYPAERIQGGITQNGETFHLDLSGRAGGRPLALKGTVDLEGPAKPVHLTITGTDLPIDARFVQAFQRPEQAEIRQVLESLRPEGVADIKAELVRDHRTGGTFELVVNGEVREGRVNFAGFPYEIEGLSGKFSYNPFERDAWVFEEVEGSHGGARLSGRGVVDLQTETALALELALVGVPIDHDLEKATLVASPELKTLWEDFDLGGSIDVERLQIGWRPGTAPQVELKGIQWKNGRITPAAMPYKWEEVAGALEWDGERLKIHSLHGLHGETYFHIDGARGKSAFVLAPLSDAVAWRVHLGDLRIIDLNPDDELRRALPIAVADALNAIDLRGPVNLHMGIDMKGWNSEEDLVTAEWWMFTVFRKNTLFAGVPLSDLTGKVEVQRGVWNGENLFLEGYVELETLSARGMPFQNVRGPFQMEGDRLTFGSPRFNERGTSHREQNPYGRRQLQADLYSGQVGLDVEVLFPDRRTAAGGDSRRTPGPPSSTPRYQVDLSVLDVELAEWAEDQVIQARRLMGKVNASAQFRGRGTDALESAGKGWIQVTPAALYELPVFAQLFSLINFRPPDNTAFTYAYGDFTVHDGLFDFSRIELVGDALSLIGRGTVGYAGQQQSTLDLDFYSKANNRIPLVKPLIERFGSNWVRIQVVGTVAKPTPLVQPRIPLLDDAFRGFMQALEAGPPRNLPRPLQRRSQQ